MRSFGPESRSLVPHLSCFADEKQSRVSAKCADGRARKFLAGLNPHLPNTNLMVFPDAREALLPGASRNADRA